MMRRKIVLLPMILALSACELPGEGPTSRDIISRSAAEQAKQMFSIVPVTPTVVRAVSAQTVPGVSEEGGPLAAGRQIGLLGPGDLLQITVWETPGSTRSNSGGAAERPTASVVTRIEQSGTITLPFVGRITAAGRRPSALEDLLVGRLSQQMISPQVSVLVTEDQTNSVILAGEVARPGRQGLTHGANRLLDVLALGGGARIPADKALVRIERQGRSVIRGLSRVQAEPALNEVLSPGDSITVLPLNRRFYAFGAVNRPGEQDFPAETQTLVQALGRISGLQDSRADRSGLFIFRRQPEVLTASLILAGQQPRPQVIYQINMRDPNAFFLASSFPIWPEDVVFVSNAPITDFARLLSLVTGLGVVAGTPRNFGLIQ